MRCCLIILLSALLSTSPIAITILLKILAWKHTFSGSINNRHHSELVFESDECSYFYTTLTLTPFLALGAMLPLEYLQSWWISGRLNIQKSRASNEGSDTSESDRDYSQLQNLAFRKWGGHLEAFRHLCSRPFLRGPLAVRCYFVCLAILATISALALTGASKIHLLTGFEPGRPATQVADINAFQQVKLVLVVPVFLYWTLVFICLFYSVSASILGGAAVYAYCVPGGEEHHRQMRK